MQAPQLDEAPSGLQNGESCVMKEIPDRKTGVSCLYTDQDFLSQPIRPRALCLRLPSGEATLPRMEFIRYILQIAL
jgi:hypothetical protein